MADYSALKATIDASINTNGQQAITGAILNDVLNEMVDVLGEGYTFLGVATISTTPTTPEGKAYYLAGAAGTYSNFGNIVVNDDEVALLVWNGTAWSKVVTGAASNEQISPAIQKINDVNASLLITTNSEFVETKTPNGYWGNNGIYYNSENYRTTIPIPVSYGDTIFVRAATAIGIVVKVNEDGSYMELLQVGEAEIKDYYVNIAFDGYITISYRNVDGPLYRIIKNGAITTIGDFLNLGWRNVVPVAQTTNGYWGNNGTFYPANTYRTSLPVKVANGDKIKITARGAVSMITKVNFDGTYISTLLTGTNIYEQHDVIVDFDGYVVFCWHQQYGIIVNIMSTKLAASENLQQLLGISWGAMGDSLTDAATLSGQSDKRNYVDLIIEQTGVQCINYGVSGSGYKRLEDADKAFYQKALTISPNCDVVTIFGSGNDQQWASIAEVGNATDMGTDTLCGCINTTIDNLLTINPLFRIGLITPTPWRAYPPFSTTATWMARYAAKIVEIANLRGLPCLDLYHKSNLRPWDDSVLSALYIDNTHPNTEGHKRIASMVKAFLIEIAG